MKRKKNRPDAHQGEVETKLSEKDFTPTRGSNVKGIIAFPNRKPGYFGGCPNCHGDNGFLNVNRTHFFVCHKHSCFWPIGANLFHGWMLEDEDAWRSNAALLANYNEIKPVYSEKFQKAW
jgi:hypothetical protein